jgi:succinoglycan biosynthesis transport protein ExoP
MARVSRSMDDVPVEGSIEFGEFFAAVRRRKLLIINVVAVSVALAGLYSYTRTPSYTSTADLLIRPILTNPLETNPAEQLSLLTEMRLATSAAVADLAKDLMGSEDSLGTILGRVVVSAPEETQILEISYTDLDPERARRGAQAFAEAYLAFKSEQAVEAITTYTTTLQAEINELDGQISALNEEIGGVTPQSPEWNDLVNTRSAAETERITLQNQLATLTTLSVDPGQIIQPADLPKSPSSPKHRLNLVFGGLIGLILGVGLAVVSKRARGGIRSRAALEEVVDAPVLGVIPRTSLGRRPSWPVTIAAPRSAAAESFRTLRTNVLAASDNPPVKTLLIASASPGEGKSTTAANLAASLAQLRRRVVLISADLRFPRVHTFFGIGNERGLGQVLTGELSLSDALRATSIPSLQILPSGPPMGVAEPVELLQSGRMQEIIAGCGDVDFVIIDGPPILAVADSLVLATMVDAVLFVADARSAQREDVEQAHYQLMQVAARVLGSVLNGFDSPRSSRAGYGPHEGFLYRILVPESVADGQGEQARPERAWQTEQARRSTG